MSVIAEHPLYGASEIVDTVFANATSFTVSEDGATCDLRCSTLTIPVGLDYGLTASISDFQGAAAWDWQHTPQP